jgi:hypothetical protein
VLSFSKFGINGKQQGFKNWRLSKEKEMKKLLCICIVLLFAAQAFAKDLINVEGESGHAIGGLVIAGLTTAAASKYWPEHRALIGFGIGTAVGIIGEGIDYYHKKEAFSSMFQDAAFTALGAAIGSLITDKYILAPVIKQDHAGNVYYGLAFLRSF